MENEFGWESEKCSDEGGVCACQSGLVKMVLSNDQSIYDFKYFLGEDIEESEGIMCDTSVFTEISEEYMQETKECQCIEMG